MNKFKLPAFALATIALITALLLIPGCGTVGTNASLSKANEVSTGTNSAHNLSLRDADKSATTSGVGPSVYSSVGGTGAQTVTSGTPIQNIVFTRDDSGHMTFAVSGGTDLTGKNITIDPNTGALTIGEVGSSASGPIKSLEPSVIEQIRATKDELIAQIQAAKDISDVAKGILVTLIEKIATGGI